MNTFPRINNLLIFLLFLAGCSTGYNPMDDYEQLEPATMLEPPAPAAQTSYPAEMVERGRYMVGLLGCGSCHTNGALVGIPNNNQLLAGSNTGIAYSNPMVERRPGVVYPSNLTPDMETGIGSWSLGQIVAMVKSGVDNHGTQSLPVMPWSSYVNINDEDANAIAMYLKSLPPVRHQVPENVPAGREATAPFVHFGVYQSRGE